MKKLSSSLIAACLLVAACSDGHSSHNNNSGAADRITLDQAWLIGTHNSYWVDRNVPLDFFASGVQENLIDQLLADHARAIELDIHPDHDTPHRYRVFHTEPGNSLCDDFVDCLRPLRLLQYALPDHELIHVIIELKEFTGPNFDSDHTVEDFESILESEIGEWMIRPGDILERCGAREDDPEPAFLDCLAEGGWPTLAEGRGKFMVSVLSNFDDLAPAKGTLDWATYALHGSLFDRSAFSMASSWKLDWDTLPEKIQQDLSREDLERARRRAAFLQVEDVADPNLAPFLAANGLVRIDGAFSLDEQRGRVALGAQILQSDTPWVQIDDRGAGQPLRSLETPSDEIVEPGDHFALETSGGSADSFAWREVTRSSSARWETLASVGGESDAVPCLAAATSPEGSAISSVALCRTKLRADRNPNLPLGSGDPDAEKIRLRQRVCRDGQCEWSDVGPGEGEAPAEGAATVAEIEVGAALALEIEAEGNGSCARAFVATDLAADGSPEWTPLGTPTCFASPLVAQGLLATGGQAGESAWFIGTRLWIGGRPAAVQPLTTAQ